MNKIFFFTCHSRIALRETVIIDALHLYVYVYVCLGVEK